LFIELKAWIDYKSPRTPLNYWRSTSGLEVDFLLNRSIALEVKATKQVQQKHLRELKALGEESGISRLIVICREDRPRKIAGIDILPWEFFLDELWVGRIL
jgi:predicted AAA+ superfamily ATPase